MVGGVCSQIGNALKTRADLAVLVGLLVVVVVLAIQQTAPVLGALPLLLVLACPLSHVFLHGKHHGGSGHNTS